MKKLCPDLAILLLAVGFLAGCAGSPYRVYPQFEAGSRDVPPDILGYRYHVHLRFEERLSGIKTVALMPPDVKVYQLTADEGRDVMLEWSEMARKNLARSMAKQVGPNARFVLKEFDPTRFPDAQQEFDDVRPLFEAVALSALAHAKYGPDGFETKVERFEYSLGPLTALAGAAEVDALLFVHVIDHISTPGRTTLRFVSGLIFALPTQGRSLEAWHGGNTGIVTALVDFMTGDLLWFSARGSTPGKGLSFVGYDLQDPGDAESLMRDVLKDLGKPVLPGK